MKKYFVYMVECSDNSYYIGVSNDVFLREIQHNEGSDPNSYTFKRRPVRLVWYQDFENPNAAIEKEKQLKGWSRKKKEALINNNLELLPELSRNNQEQKHFDKLIVTSDIENYFWILDKLPYSKPFLFVEKLEKIHEDGAVGHYTFSEDESFYQGHFKGNPVTPGVILTECCAQIGVVCLGIFLLKDSLKQNIQIGLSSSEMEFLIPVYPNEKVKVVSEKVYFRFHKLKCKVKMFNSHDQLVCSGTISGMFKLNQNEE